ncbi:Ribosomal RNA small subunit methyltransferase B [Candidatus Ornithobacterium hominis]|uniref:Ribosomal RNA small subunit methyltransferase B n=1 Tax=Candidatus Ornithobacterium hominis TaxID=2497989 RepID=A0A383U3V6_9FLAO|nr:methyltransferase domain-containing protein [Candidatus Ornithobacterium hominis]MCT7904682.1 methyltransferase domain-containing protein [Candidatus Ornithobacterium hominis]SZD73976.1 Ribosomal RNA small subunit methyltransferase B [Candidatus Ornithobacterium hominis]
MKDFLPYRNLYVGSIEILKAVFLENKYTDKEIEKCFKRNKQWGSRDRGFVAELIYECVRWKRLINYASGNSLEQKNYWKFIATWMIINDAEIPDLDEFKSLRINREKVKKNFRDAHRNPAIEQSVSEELKALGLQQLPERFWKEIQVMNQPAPAILRTNTLVNSRSELIKKLKKENVEVKPLQKFPEALVLAEKENIFLTQAFKDGSFEMQDASSQQVAHFCEVKPGMRVADACAGAGGKSLHLSALMENKGQIISMDIYEWKLKELKRRAKRNHSHNVQIKFIESSKTIKRFHQSFDRVLIDAPCTGIGILGRNPDAKYKIDFSFFDRVLREQKEILRNYAEMVKKEGLLIYATCSIFPAENKQQVQAFLEENQNFEFVEDRMLWPSETGYDGFYMAKMRRLKG